MLALCAPLRVSAQPGPERRPEGEARRELRAHPRGEATITIDGMLSEPGWRDAPIGGEFVERSPRPGATPPVRTQVRVLFDQDALYVGIEAFLAPGEVPRAVELSRDSFNIFSDDALSVKVDVRRDRRTTVGFAINAAGAQLDYIAIDNGRQFRREYDAVWESAAQVLPDRWVAEFRLPAAALGLGPLDDEERERVLGLNITRDHNAARGTYDWSPIPVEFGAVSAVHYGDLRGLRGMAGGRPLVLIPYLLGGYRQADGASLFPIGSAAVVSAGLDARLRVAEDTWVELTTLTDFAQVDLDDPAVNFDRFPLFFSERRPFFLTGLDVFEFGEQSVAQPFFTRRLGLDESREEVPMLGGLKLYGRHSFDARTSLAYGALDVLTGGYGGDPLQNVAVTRLRLNVGRTSYVGALATMRYLEGRDPDFSAGADFVARVLDERLEIRGFASGSFNARLDEDDAPRTGRDRGAAARLRLYWRGRAWRPDLTVLWVDEHYDPAVGFVRRRGIAQSTATLHYQHRTSWGGLAQADYVFRYTQIATHELSRDLGRNAHGDFYFEWVNGFWTYFRLDYDEDVVESAFEIAGRDVAPGRYRGAQVFAGVGRSNARNPGFSLEYSGEGSFFGGVRQALSGSFELALGPWVRITLSGNAAFVKLPSYPMFETFYGALSLNVTPTTFLQIDGSAQLNTVDRSVVGLARLRWRYLPGSDIFAVYRVRTAYDERVDPDDPAERDRVATDHRVLVKVVFRYDRLL